VISLEFNALKSSIGSFIRSFKARVRLTTSLGENGFISNRFTLLRHARAHGRIYAPSVLEQRGIYYRCFAITSESSSSRARVAIETKTESNDDG